MIMNNLWDFVSLFPQNGDFLASLFVASFTGELANEILYFYFSLKFPAGKTFLLSLSTNILLKLVKLLSAWRKKKPKVFPHSAWGTLLTQIEKNIDFPPAANIFLIRTWWEYLQWKLWAESMKWMEGKCVFFLVKWNFFKKLNNSVCELIINRVKFFLKSPKEFLIKLEFLSFIYAMFVPYHIK